MNNGKKYCYITDPTILHLMWLVEQYHVTFLFGFGLFMVTVIFSKFQQKMITTCRNGGENKQTTNDPTQSMWLVEEHHVTPLLKIILFSLIILICQKRFKQKNKMDTIFF